MRLRRLCLAIFALRLFLREPIQIFKFASADSTIRCAAMATTSSQVRCINPIISLTSASRFAFKLAPGFPLRKFVAIGDLITDFESEVEHPALRRKGPSLDQLRPRPDDNGARCNRLSFAGRNLPVSR